jgi:Flp pilus assembly protein TadD
MSRWLAVALLMAFSGLAQEKIPPTHEQQEPPEEDQNLVKKSYVFNPLQASKELQVGNYYMKKGSFRAAAERFREATRWNEGEAEAWLRLGDASEKLRDPKAARDAYQKYLDLAPDAKDATRIRKKLQRVK